MDTKFRRTKQHLTLDETAQPGERVITLCKREITMADPEALTGLPWCGRCQRLEEKIMAEMKESADV